MAYQPDNEGLFPVHVAAITNQTVAVHILLMECPGCVGLRDGRGRTFLHSAVQHEGSSVVRYACRRPECASIINAQDEDGNTALHLTVVAEKLRMLCDLLTNREVCLNLRNSRTRRRRIWPWPTSVKDSSIDGYKLFLSLSLSKFGRWS